MRSPASASLVLARRLAAVMASVVMAFLAASLAAGWYARTIDTDVAELVDNAMRSLHELSTLRGALHDADSHAALYAGGARTGSGDVTAADPFDGDRRALEVAWARYTALPEFPDE